MYSVLLRLVFSSLLAIQPALASAQTYHFVAIENLYEQQVGAIIIAELYKRLDIDISIQPMPGKRAIAEATSGRKDGEIMRIWTYGEEHPELIRVPTPYYQIETRGFFKAGSRVQAETVDDLKRYEVFKVRGVKHTNNITAGLDNIYDYDNTEMMLKALHKSRPSIALTHTADGMFTAKKHRIKGIEMLAEPLAKLELYHYLHNSKRHLVDKVDAMIQAMKSRGDLEKLIQQAEAQVAENY